MTDGVHFAAPDSRDYLDTLTRKLSVSSVCERREAQAVAVGLIEHYAGLSLASILTGKQIADAVKILIESALEKVIAGQPLQYVLGESHFYGRKFIVNPEVLIPRRETEELVDLIIRDHRASGWGRGVTVLDLATGSGCIAVTLAGELPAARVFATDISPGALDIARRNGDANRTGVTFALHDMLGDMPLPFDTGFDIMVSNPPYVRLSEKPTVPSNVLNHEPHRALFVPDSAPLVFYDAYLRIAATRLRPGGRLYVEINETLGRETVNLFETRGFEAELLKDMSGRNRIVKSTKRISVLTDVEPVAIVSATSARTTNKETDNPA